MDRRHALAASVLINASILALMLTAVFLVVVPVPSHAQACEEGVYQENFDDGQAQGWNLDPGWEVDQIGRDWMLVGSSYGKMSEWARYTEGRWCEGRFTFRFSLVFLNGTMHANFHVNGPDRYFIEFRYEMGGLYVDLLKQRGYVPPESPLRSWEIDYGTRMQVEIVTEGGHISLNVEGHSAIDYLDAEPLPAGTIAFEMIHGGSALDNISVIGPRPTVTTENTTTVTLTISKTTTSTSIVQAVPEIFYLYVTVAAAAIGGLGVAAGHALGKIPSPRPTPPLPDLRSINQRIIEIEDLGKVRTPSPLGGATDVENMLHSVKASVDKARDTLKRLKAAKDEKEAVEALVEFVEQLRNSSEDVGSFTDFLAQRVTGGKQGNELPWFNILTVNLLEMERALDSATIMVRQYPSGALLFEGLARNYTFLSSSAQVAERAFTLADIDQINAALSRLKKAKSQLDVALGGVSRGLADWYRRLSWEKYFGAATSLVK